MGALLNSESKVNAINLAYVNKLSLQIQKINIGAPKINESSLDIFEIVIVSFQAQDKLGNARFFQEVFLVADTKIDIVFRIPFLTFNNADIWFTEGDLT